MQTIRSHDITLYGGYGSMKLVLRPLRDDDLPYLYRWNADPEVLYWTEGGEAGATLSYSPEEVRGIYGSVSQDALVFLIEVDGRAVGECWLQPMNLQEICTRYPEGADVRRIDIMIGEKDCWNRGIGTRVIAMLTEYAFAGEMTDVLHCLCDDYNLRSRRIWEKNGFSLAGSQPLPEGQKGKMQLHYRLTRREYIANRRYRGPDKKIERLPVSSLSPSQLYISEGKLRLCREWFTPKFLVDMDPILYKRFQGLRLITDGHTRAVMAYLAGIEQVPCCVDEDELDMTAYAKDRAWCIQQGVHTVGDLASRIVSVKEYETLWRKRCMEG
ncbi:MAG: GNAT family N-acetyltransferase [Christensenellaceae bacterium]